MNADFLKNNLHFKEGIKNSYYKKIGGFLYTVDATNEDEIFLYVNLPQTDDTFKKAFAEFLKENVKNLIKERVVKNGFKITFSPDAFNKKNFIVKTAQQISQYLKEQGIAFNEKKLPIAFKNNMHVFETENARVEYKEETAEEIIIDTANDNVEEVIETPLEENTEKLSFKDKFFKVIDKIPVQIMLLVIYVLCAVLFMILSLFSTNVAAATGYIMGWLPASVLVRHKKKNSSIFIIVTLLSFITLSLTASYSFLFAFLSQSEIYTAIEFFTQSLEPAYCIFNVVLGLLLSVFGTYSTIPQTKKAKQQIDEDFQ